MGAAMGNSPGGILIGGFLGGFLSGQTQRSFFFPTHSQGGEHAEFAAPGAPTTIANTPMAMSLEGGRVNEVPSSRRSLG